VDEWDSISILWDAPGGDTNGLYRERQKHKSGRTKTDTENRTSLCRLRSPVYHDRTRLAAGNRLCLYGDISNHLC
jgi:hypothetical protein